MNATPLKDLVPLDVIQLGPSAPWPYALAIVTELKLWGCVADLQLPHARGMPPRCTPVRLAWGEFLRIGPAPYRPVLLRDDAMPGEVPT